MPEFWDNKVRPKNQKKDAKHWNKEKLCVQEKKIVSVKYETISTMTEKKNKKR